MRILFVQFRRIGDVLLTTPALAALKTDLKEAQIDVLVESPGASILQGNPHINEILVYDSSRSLQEILRIRKRRYDAVIDFMANPRSAYLTALSGAKSRVAFRKHINFIFYNYAIAAPKERTYVPLVKIRLLHEWLKCLGYTPKEPAQIKPQLFLNDRDESYGKTWAKENKGYVVFAPAGRRPARFWQAEGYRAVGLRLAQEKGLNVFLAWGPGEESVMKQVSDGTDGKIQLLPKTTLTEMAAIFKNAKFLISNDSAPMHLAIAVGTPTIGIYGPTNPIDWNPSLSEENPDGKNIVLRLENLASDTVFSACEKLLMRSK